MPDSPKRPRRWRLPLAVVGLLGLAGLVWLGVTGVLAVRESRALAGSLAELEAGARALDAGRVADELPRARESARRVSQLTSGPPWWLAERLPRVGDTVRSGRALASAADGLLGATEPMDPVVRAVADGRLRTPAGGLDLDLVGGSATGLRAVAAAVPPALADLSRVDPASLPAELAPQVRQLEALLPPLAAQLTAAAESAERLTPLLGGSGPRAWLVLLQNPSEARGTGGFIGGYALITADSGRLSIAKAGPNQDLVANQPIDYSSLPQETQDLWGRDLAEWQAINLSPHFPHTGQLALQGMRQMGLEVDGVVAVDPQVVAWLLAATGPVQVGGRTVTTDTAVDYVTRQVYVDNPDDAAKDTALLSLLTQSLSGLTSGDIDVRALLTGAAPVLGERHLQAYSTRPDEQAWLETTPMGGVISDEPGPDVVVALNNGAGNKVDAFMRTSARYVAGSCNQTASQFSSLTLTLANEAPRSGLPSVMTVRNDDPRAAPAGERMLVAVHGPVGGVLMTATLDGLPAFTATGKDRGRPVWTTVMQVDPGQVVTLDLGFTEPAAAGEQPTLRLPAMVNPPEVSVGTQGCEAEG